MKSQEFLIMMQQDTETMKEAEKSLYGTLVNCMKDAVGDANFDIPSNKNLEDAYKQLEKHARENRLQCVDIPAATKIMKKYLGVPEDARPVSAAIADINLDDFI